MACRVSFIAAALATLPRGGGNGDDIRLGILQIMRENGIKEGHRPGIEDPFIEQWHQKLHSNTTVDDIYICEAYLHFLHTGNWEDFWTHLWENHKLTREDLAAMKAGWRTEGIIGPGNHLPFLIDPMKHFYWILRITHGGGNMDSAMDFARGNMPEDIQYDIDDMLAHRDEPWVPNKIVEIRERLSGTWRYGEDVNRDVCLLDIAMDKFYRNKIEGYPVAGLTADERLGMLEFAVRNVCVGGDFDKMQAALAFFQKANGAESGHERWTPEWALAMDAALESVSLAMEHHMDQFCELAQYPADVIGMQAECDDQYILNFGEEACAATPCSRCPNFWATRVPAVRTARAARLAGNRVSRKARDFPPRRDTDCRSPGGHPGHGLQRGARRRALRQAGRPRGYPVGGRGGVHGVPRGSSLAHRHSCETNGRAPRGDARSRRMGRTHDHGGPGREDRRGRRRGEGFRVGARRRRRRHRRRTAHRTVHRGPRPHPQARLRGVDRRPGKVRRGHRGRQVQLPLRPRVQPDALHLRAHVRADEEGRSQGAHVERVAVQRV